MRNSVDLPQPEGPTSETNSPAPTRNEMSASASTGPLAAGQGARQPVGVPLETDQLEQFLDPGALAVAAGAAQPQRVADVAGDGEVVEELAVLEDHGEPAPVRRGAREVLAVPGDAAPGLLEAGDAAQQRGLAAARGPEDGQHGAVGDVEVDVADGRHAVVRHREVAQGQRHSAPRDGTRSRSTASMTSAVVAASTTQAAIAVP